LTIEQDGKSFSNLQKRNRNIQKCERNKKMWMIKEIGLKEERGDMPEPAGRICRKEYPGAATGFSQF
jgi:hypothetical protein